MIKSIELDNFKLNYILVLILSFAVTIIISEVVYRILGIRFLFRIGRK